MAKGLKSLFGAKAVVATPAEQLCLAEIVASLKKHNCDIVCVPKYLMTDHGTWELSTADIAVVPRKAGPPLPNTLPKELAVPEEVK